MAFWYEPAYYDFAKVLHGIPETATVLAFPHNPDIYYELPNGIAISFAGHTHGGQVSFPVLGRLIVPSRSGEKLALGYIAEQGRPVLVTGGMGISILPVRFRMPSEISAVVLESNIPLP